MAETLSEQVAELEAREEALMKQVQRCIDERNGFLDEIAKANQARIAPESALAQARVEGARMLAAGARMLAAEIVGELASNNLPGAARVVMEYVGRKYPATGDEPTRDVPEPPRVVRLSGGRVMRWAHNEFGVAWLCRSGAELPPMHFFRNSRGERMYDYRVIAETPEDFTTLERLVQEVCAYLASRPTASGEG